MSALPRPCRSLGDALIEALVKADAASRGPRWSGSPPATCSTPRKVIEAVAGNIATCAVGPVGFQNMICSNPIVTNHPHHRPHELRKPKGECRENTVPYRNRSLSRLPPVPPRSLASATGDTSRTRRTS